MTIRRFGSIGSCLLGLLSAFGLATLEQTAAAAPQKIAEFNEKGNFLLIGNTLGWDCAAGTPQPVVGTVNSGSCGTNTDDSSADILWSTDLNGTTASADGMTTPLYASSAAFLSIPQGAVVVHARLFWAAQLPLNASAGRQVGFDRPGGFKTVITNDPSYPGLTVNSGGRTYYQGNADITKLVQQNGSGVYRVAGVPTTSLKDVLENVAFVNWHMAVVYRKKDEPTRNIVIYRGMDIVQQGANANATLDGFLVPNAGFSGQLGIIGYEGDDSLTGDSFLFNGSVLSNPLNPATNFFNSTRSTLGSPVSITGDLPQMSGQPSSMVGIDLDVVDVTAQLSAGATSAQLGATSNGDLFFLGGFATGISTLFPVFSDSTKTYANVSRPGKPVIPGDTVKYTLTVLNNGSDTSINTVLRDPLPPELTYVPGSLNITSGTNSGAKTDAAGDDQAEYDPNTRTLVIRLGTGANASTGGTVAVGDTTTIEFNAVVSRAISGRLDNQGNISGQGQLAVAKGVTRAGAWLTGDGSAPSIPTSIFVNCQSDLQCGALAPKCDRTLSPPRCACTANTDCPNGLVCDPTSRACVQCTAGQATGCSSSGTGAVCMADNRCGCYSDADCGGRICDLGSLTCPSPKTDLSVVVIPPATPSPPGSTAVYSVQITDLGVDPVTNANIITQLPPGITGASWTCTAVGAGAMCPAPSGQGPLPSTVSLPAGGQLIYTLSVPVPQGYTSETVPLRVTALPPAGSVDPRPSNNVGYGEAVITQTTQPDLVLTVDGQLGPEPYSIQYTANTTNKGTGAAGGAFFSYTAPEGSTVTDVQPGEGWTCKVSSDKRYLSCETTTPIPPQGSAPPVVFVVKSPKGSTPQPFEATVTPRDELGFARTDANPADNTVTKSFDVSDAKLAGNGFGCTVAAPRSEGLAPFGALAGFLLTCTALLRRRRA
jgi:uncharacterized repeat protein (TIGR01451 family)